MDELLSCSTLPQIVDSSPCELGLSFTLFVKNIQTVVDHLLFFLSFSKDSCRQSVGTPISTGTTASAPNVSENGDSLFALRGVVLYAQSTP